MPSNPTLPENVREQWIKVIEDAVARHCEPHDGYPDMDDILDSVAPLIIEWARKDQAEKDARLIEPQSATMGAFLAGVIRDQFPTPDETTGAPDDHQ